MDRQMELEDVFFEILRIQNIGLSSSSLQLYTSSMLKGPFNFFLRISTLGHILRLTIFLEFAILPCPMRKNLKMLSSGNRGDFSGNQVDFHLLFRTLGRHFRKPCRHLETGQTIRETWRAFQEARQAFRETRQAFRETGQALGLPTISEICQILRGPQGPTTVVEGH